MKHKAWILAAAALLLITATIFIVKRCTADEQEALPMEPTLLSIEDVMPRGELYLCSALIEDYTTERATEEHLLWTDEEHACVLTMTQKCSYKIDLSKVTYQADPTTRVAQVKLPEPEYTATTQSTAFLSDDSNYWADHMPSTNAMKQRTEQQIRRRFDTPANRRKAQRFAEDAISAILQEMGYECEFVRELEKPLAHFSTCNSPWADCEKS